MKKNVGSKLPKLSRDQSEQLINSVDFLGVNYYSISYVKDDPQDAPSNRRDFMNDASIKTTLDNSTTQAYVPGYGLQEVLEYFKRSYGNPLIYIHENGYPMSQNVVFDDGPRVGFLSEHLRSILNSVRKCFSFCSRSLQWCKKRVQYRNGSNTKGYFIWSLVDLFELLSGNQRSYGLYYVDFADKDLKRYPRRSAFWYADFLKGRRVAISGRYSDSVPQMSSA